MKITKELLQRHSLGICSEEEKKAVEEWFSAKEDSDTGLLMVNDEQINEKRISFKLGQLSPELQSLHTPGQTIPLYRKVARYAAAACILLMTFFGGRFSVSTAHGAAIAKEAPKDLLYLFGSNGAKEQFPGNEFNIKIAGTIRLNNSAFSYKTIKVGDTSFKLAPNNHYFLSGTTENPILKDAGSPDFENQEPDLKGAFSLSRIDQ